MKVKMKSILDAWASFESQVINKDAGENQRKAMHLAFFGGAKATMGLCTYGMPEDEDEAEAFLKQLQDDIDAQCAEIIVAGAVVH